MTNYFFSIFASLLLIGCGKPQPQNEAPETHQLSNPAATPGFDAQKAFSYLVAQTNFGPRNPGSSGHSNCLSYLRNEMLSFTPSVNNQPFTVSGYDKEVLKLTNIISSFNPTATTRILLLAHWDSRPRAENDKDPKKRNKPILGANDGASGVAILMEIARQVKEHPPGVGVDIVFVDGEDYGKEGDTRFYLLGAKYFAKNLPPGFAPAFGILLDMVGDKDLQIPKDRYSMEYAPDIVDLVWSTARNLKIPQFIDAPSRGWTTDDHIPINEAGIKCIDLIDFEYPDASNRYWHTTEDTPDKCSPESLEAVGTVLLNVIYQYKP